MPIIWYSPLPPLTPRRPHLTRRSQVGLTDGQSPEQWQKDISDAKAVGIDGFALNIGPSDPWTVTQLQQAYAAAEAASFGLFLSFDMQTGSWDSPAVVDLINTFKDSGAQVRRDEKPLVSTFEGSAWADQWEGVRQQTGGIFLVPDWSSIGPNGLRDKLGVVDGACKCFLERSLGLMLTSAVSWNAWPRAGETKMITEEDMLYKNVLGDKPYMMGVSPSFYVSKCLPLTLDHQNSR